MAPLVVFLVDIGFLLDSTNGRLPYTSFRLDLTQRIVFMKKEDDSSALSRGYGTHDGSRKERDG